MPSGHARMMALLVLLAASPCSDGWREGTRHQPASAAVRVVQGADGSSVSVKAEAGGFGCQAACCS